MFFRHWIQQIRAIIDDGNSKPILIVGTHADQLPKKEDPIEKLQNMVQVLCLGRNELKGCFSVSMSSGMGTLKAQTSNSFLKIITQHHTVL